ncbi:MAG: lipid IV(A) 3-deoxy-D-manno-octulosonic acid transferase [Coxiellaceae bacterium]|nr:lipid IV(A) 3-deoxy-D-manno-octulosonic acid transferase [Coxiellaceae bacterium]
MSLLAKLSRRIYTILHYLSLPAIMIRLLWRSRYTIAYRQRWSERFGYIKRVTETDASIWIHAVSLGEANAAIPLIKELIVRYPQYTIVVTTTTPTGSAQIVRHLKDDVMHVYAPYDVPWMVKRFLRRSRTKLCIIMETEIWPNILHSCRYYNVPIFLANARLSERSKLRYQLIGRLTKSMLLTYSMVSAQGLLDGERLLSLGLEPKKLMISGNIKFDIQLPEKINDDGKSLRKEWGAENRPIFIAASTHEGEEEIIIDAFKRIKEQLPNVLLILVPRHPDRFPRVEKLCKDSGLNLVLRSLNQIPTDDTDMILGDTMGELLLLYAASDIAFVGGSLAPIGGHNLIEPAAIGMPVLTGPQLHNFTEISRLLQNSGTAQIVHDAKSIATAVNALFSATELREKMGARAKEVIAANSGALEKHLEWIEKNFPPQRRLYNA